MNQSTCPVCQLPIVRRALTGPMPTYCSTSCKGRAWRASHYQGPAERANVPCQWVGCDVSLPVKAGPGRMSKWCATHRAEKKRLEPKDNLARECSYPDCARPVRARGLCSMHWKRARADEIGHAKQSFDGERMRRHYERRTWQRSGESVTVAGLRERDGDCCGLCGDVIDFSLSGRDPMGRSVDHVLPRSRGGAHTWDNCQLTHLRCNLSKGATVPQ